MPGREVFAAASRHVAAHLPRLRALAVAGDRAAQPGQSKQTSLYPTEGSSCHREPTSTASRSFPRYRSQPTSFMLVGCEDPSWARREHHPCLRELSCHVSDDRDES